MPLAPIKPMAPLNMHGDGEHFSGNMGDRHPGVGCYPLSIIHTSDAPANKRLSETNMAMRSVH